MRLIVLVNDATALGATQTTTLLIGRAAARGHDTWVAGVDGVGLRPDDRVTLQARRAPALEGRALTEALRAQVPEALALGPGDALFIRTNPARDARRAFAHDTALELARIARDQGVAVMSDPEGLMRASSKLYLSVLPPRFRPHTLVSRDVDALRAFIADAPGDCVLKPLRGTHGRDVFVVRKDNPQNVRQIIDVLTRGGFAMAQRFVPEAVQGDTRVLVLEGQLLRVGGRAAAVRRVPGGDDFRSNVSAGGRSARGAFRPVMQEIVDAIGPRLEADGVLLAGLDLIGDVVVEVNVYSPGGVADMGQHEGVDFAGPILDAVERGWRR
ncbi:MAG: hypothetical protein H6739_12575 [Alphaproteobacteria bacterium]|nr:hypothetical protein [Alphaproteobacteria bacterium]